MRLRIYAVSIGDRVVVWGGTDPGTSSPTDCDFFFFLCAMPSKNPEQQRRKLFIVQPVRVLYPTRVLYRVLISALPAAVCLVKYSAKRMSHQTFYDRFFAMS